MNNSDLRKTEDINFILKTDKCIKKHSQPYHFSALEIHAKFQHYRSENYAQTVQSCSCTSIKSDTYKKMFSAFKKDKPEEKIVQEINLSRSVPSSPKRIHISGKSSTLPSASVYNVHCSDTRSSISKFFKKISPKLKQNCSKSKTTKPLTPVEFSKDRVDKNASDRLMIEKENCRSCELSSSRKDLCDKCASKHQCNKDLYITNATLKTVDKIHNKNTSQAISLKKKKCGEEVNQRSSGSIISKLYVKNTSRGLSSSKCAKKKKYFIDDCLNKKFYKKKPVHPQIYLPRDHLEVPTTTTADSHQKEPVNEILAQSQKFAGTFKSLSMTSLKDEPSDQKNYIPSKLVSTKVSHSYTTDSSLLVPEASVHPRKIQPPQTLSLHSKIFVHSPQIDRVASKMASVESIGSCSLDLDESESSCASDMKDEVTVSEKTLKSSVLLSNCDTEQVKGTNYHPTTKEEKSSSDGSATKVSKRSDSINKEECSVAEIKLPSYVSISCAINGYTSYGRFCRSRDNSPARFPLSSSPSKNLEYAHPSHLSSNHVTKGETKECNGNILYKESKEVYICKQLEIPLTNGSAAQTVEQHNTFDRMNGKSEDVPDRAVNGHDEEKGILLETLQEFGGTTSKHKSLVLQRIESLYGPSAEEICKVRPRNSRLVEPVDKNVSTTRRSPSCPPQVIRNQSRSPPVFRHLTKDFKEQLRENGYSSHNGTKDINEIIDISGKSIQPPKSNLSQISSLPLSPKDSSEKDGHWFISLMENEKHVLRQQIVNTEKYLTDTSIPEEICGKIRSAIGKANLLLSQKFEQFHQLCEKNISQDISEPIPTSSDLAGFWDLVLLQVSDVKNTFDEINKLKENDWKETSSPEKLQCRPKIRKQITPGISKSNPSTPSRSSKSAELAKAREIARKQLMEAKRRGRQQNTAQDIETEIAIFVPQNANQH